MEENRSSRSVAGLFISKPKYLMGALTGPSIFTPLHDEISGQKKQKKFHWFLL